MYLYIRKKWQQQQPDKLGMSKGISPVRVVILAFALIIISVSFFFLLHLFASVKDKGNLLKKLILFYVYKEKLVPE